MGMTIALSLHESLNADHLLEPVRGSRQSAVGHIPVEVRHSTPSHRLKPRCWEVAQWQSFWLLTRRLQVRLPPSQPKHLAPRSSYNEHAGPLRSNDRRACFGTLPMERPRTPPR